MGIEFTSGCCWSTCVIPILVVFLTWVVFLRGHKRSQTALTRRLLTENDTVEPECKSLCSAICEAEAVVDEAKCAEQMRCIVQAGHLRYSTLATHPQYLLRATRHLSVSDHGALATRFTVQYNLFAGSIVALGTDAQRELLYATQDRGELGCFAFTEIGAGVLSGAGVETTAIYNEFTQTFTITSPTSSSRKTWISQGVFAEHAVILANIIMPDGSDKGPHLFFARIQNRNESTGELTAVNSGIQVSSLPQKTSLRGLDNAFITFDNFEVPRTALLSRFSSVLESGQYQLNLPPGNKRMLDLLISRLLTGRVCLSEYTVGVARSIVRTSYDYATSRELWRNPRSKSTAPNKMIDKPLISATFVDYSESLTVIASYIARVRERVAGCIQDAAFPRHVLEAVCICKFVGTSVGVDAVSVMRKTMGSRALMEDSRLGASSFVCNATCAAEGDNTVMELKVVRDVVMGGFSTLFPLGLMCRSLTRAITRNVLCKYICLVMEAMWLGKKAMDEGQLLRDLAWARAHLLILDDWYAHGMKSYGASADIRQVADSYAHVLVRFPTPPQF